MENDNLLQIVEYLKNSDEDIAAIGFEILNNSDDLTLEYKLSCLQKAGFQVKKYHKDVKEIFTTLLDKKYVYNDGLFTNKTCYSKTRGIYEQLKTINRVHYDLNDFSVNNILHALKNMYDK